LRSVHHPFSAWFREDRQTSNKNDEKQEDWKGDDQTSKKSNHRDQDDSDCYADETPILKNLELRGGIESELPAPWAPHRQNALPF
jgi:hypothetical protein